MLRVIINNEWQREAPDAKDPLNAQPVMLNSFQWVGTRRRKGNRRPPGVGRDTDTSGSMSLFKPLRYR